MTDLSGHVGLPASSLRIATIGPSATDCVISLGLGESIVWCTDPMPWHHSSTVQVFPTTIDIADTRWLDDDTNCPITEVQCAEWMVGLTAMHPSIVIGDHLCAKCATSADQTPQAAWRYLGIGRPALADCIAILPRVAEALGVSVRGDTLRRNREARMLALRMHVARYLTRTPGAFRPQVAVVKSIENAWIDCTDRRTEELVDGAGGTLVPWRTIDHRARDTIVIRSRADAHVGGVDAPRMSSPLPVTWDAAWDSLTAISGPSVVDALEAVLRAVYPRALGANGTPPNTDLIWR